MGLRLNVVRGISGVTQVQLSRHTGVNQAILSLFENGETEYLHYEQKKMIENILGLKIDWSTTPEEDPLSRAEIRDMRFFYKTLTNNAPVEEVNSWLSGFDTSREAYTEAKRVIDTNVVAIPVLEMKWNSDGTPDFSHID